MKNILNDEKLINIHMDFKTKTRVPCEKSGRHSNPIYLVLKPLTNPGRHSDSVYFVLKP